MKRKLLYFFLPLMAAWGLLGACVDVEQYDNNPRGNFEALWRIIDEHYCFFDYKQQEYGLDWHAIYNKYAPQFDDQMTEEQTFEVLTNMLGELKDGHVNLYAPFDVGRDWSWKEDYPTHFSENVLKLYLGKDYKIAAGMKYRILNDNVAYLRCATFVNDFGAGNLDRILLYFAPCNGLIIDLRENGGGMVTSAEALAARFTNEEVLVGYMQHKTGPGHNDFSPRRQQILKPSKGLRWQKRVVVLTNRGVYSAANEFVKYMKCLPQVTIVGDRTGGGAGLPFSSELPNGWIVRFSACPMYDRDGKDTEFGIAPTHQVGMKPTDQARGKDTLIEYARKLLAK
jgi:carboxyl-protease-related protein